MKQSNGLLLANETKQHLHALASYRAAAEAATMARELAEEDRHARQSEATSRRIAEAEAANSPENMAARIAARRAIVEGCSPCFLNSRLSQF